MSRPGPLPRRTLFVQTSKQTTSPEGSGLRGGGSPGRGGDPRRQKCRWEWGSSRHLRECQPGGFRRNSWWPKSRGGRSHPHRREASPHVGPGRGCTEPREVGKPVRCWTRCRAAFYGAPPSSQELRDSVASSSDVLGEEAKGPRQEGICLA